MPFNLFIIVIATRVNILCSKVCSKHFTCIVSLNHSNTCMRKTFVIVFILLIKKPEAQKCRYLLKITQLVQKQRQNVDSGLSESWA